MSDEQTIDEPKGQEAQEAPKRSGKPVAVRVIRIDKGGALVEWQEGDDLRRAVVSPLALAKDKAGKVTCERAAIDDGERYGAAWEDIELSASPGDVARELRRRGIWTYGDLQRNPQAAMAALQAAYRTDFAALVRFAKG